MYSELFIQVYCTFKNDKCADVAERLDIPVQDIIKWNVAQYSGLKASAKLRLGTHLLLAASDGISEAAPLTDVESLSDSEPLSQLLSATPQCSNHPMPPQQCGGTNITQNQADTVVRAAVERALAGSKAAAPKRAAARVESDAAKESPIESEIIDLTGPEQPDVPPAASAVQGALSASEVDSCEGTALWHKFEFVGKGVTHMPCPFAVPLCFTPQRLTPRVAIHFRQLYIQC